MRVTVDGAAADARDLVVRSPSVSDSRPSAGQSFTLRVTVHNQGTHPGVIPGGALLHYFRSSNATITTGDRKIGTDGGLPHIGIGGVSRSSSLRSIMLTAPSSAGTYYYGACVDAVLGEVNTNNNCSSAVRVTVGDVETPPPPPPAGPDLVVEMHSVSDSRLSMGQLFKLGRTVRNQGVLRSPGTVVRYLRSSDAMITQGDTSFATGPVFYDDGLPAGGIDDYVWHVTAPWAAGTYYYGVCIDDVPGEVNTANNCSNAVRVTVGDVAAGGP